ncbi:MAG: hypothetical protein MUD10_00285 [Candidatus Pacebacteria bacterium]|jgi:hypothetical protein|nr:hypothetical protein [Candidatus Paceibacterota bacterium]
MLLSLATIYFAAGILLAAAVIVRPKLFWPVLVAASVFSAGLMAAGYTFFDEYFIGCALAGGIFALFLGRVKFYERKKGIAESLHGVAFALLVSYMVFESLRGMAVMASPEKARWIVFFLMLGLVGFIASKKNFPMPSGRRLALLVSGSFAAYLFYYIVYGFLTEKLRGLSRYAIQPGEWSTTAYALFPAVIGVPAAIILMMDKSRSYRVIGGLTLGLAVLASLYYSARIALLAIVAFVLTSVFHLGLKRIAVFAVFSVLMIGLVYGVENRGELARISGAVAKSLYGAVQNIRFWENSPKDIDRRVHLESSFMAVGGNWQVALFGYGYRVHGNVIGPYLRRLYEEKGFPELAAGVGANESTEGFTALLVDTGYVGIFLLLLNFSFAALAVMFVNGNKNRFLLVSGLAIAILWLPVINMLDAMFFYLLAMPNGLMARLAGDSQESNINA